MPGQVYTCTDSRGREVGGGKNNHKRGVGSVTCLTCGVLKLMNHVAESRATSAAQSTTFGVSVYYSLPRHNSLRDTLPGAMQYAARMSNLNPVGQSRM